MRKACIPAMLAALLAGCVCPVFGAERLTRPGLDTSGVVKGNTAFALDLYEALRGEKGNLFFSPMSVSAALGMTYAGARGKTAQEMTTALHFPSRGSNLHTALGRLLKDIEKTAGAKGCQLNIANALWGQSGHAFLDNFLNMVQDNYGAGLKQVDFVGATEASRRTINKWVAGKTRQKIRNLIPQGALDAMTRLVLTNAIYFKGDWATQFDKRLTKNAPFRLSADKSRSVMAPMMRMRKTGEFPYMSGKGFQALELPYKGDALSMVIFLPNEVEGYSEFEKTLTPENLDRWLKSLRERKVVVSLPRFRMTIRFELSDTLKKMGMPLAFNSGKADFSGMDGTKSLFISKVIHKAFVDVNEKGTEAAAATAIAMKLGEAPATPVFRADHPFIFLIRDRKSGSIIFIGRVVNPAQRG